MDQLLSKAGSTLVTFAVRSGVQLASTYVIKSVSGLMDNVPEKQRRKLERLRNQLQDNIEIVTYSIEMIQLMAARGNTNLDSVLRLSNYLKEDINEFREDISLLTEDLGTKKMNTDSVKFIETYINALITKIDQLIPILNLVLTTSGASITDQFNDHVSPGRLLNATILLNDSNIKFDKNENEKVQIGPDFILTLYDIFYNHAKSLHGGPEITWKEKFAKCKLQLFRLHDENFHFYYKLCITEDFNDDRYHDDDEKPEEKEYDLRMISRLFFSASGRLLKLEDRSSPVLVLKIRKLSKKELDERVLGNEETASLQEEDSDKFDWLAVGDYEANEECSDDDSDDDENADFEKKATEHATPLDKISGGSPLALLEYLLRLCTLQTNDQTTLLKVKDERLKMYLIDENCISIKKPPSIPSLSRKLENLQI